MTVEKCWFDLAAASFRVDLATPGVKDGNADCHSSICLLKVSSLAEFLEREERTDPPSHLVIFLKVDWTPCFIFSCVYTNFVATYLDNG
eukprot:s2736_g6.t1